MKARPDGVVKVLDFGLAKALGPTGSDVLASQSPTITTPAMTQAGMVLGTAAYMSPEQVKGRTVDKRSDVWAFGAVLFEMLSGQRAFGGEDISETLADVMRVEPAWEALPQELSPSLTTFLKRCLQKDPKQRLGDIHDMRLALEGAFEIRAVQTPEPVGVPQFGVRLRLALATLVGGLVVGLAAWSLWPTPAPNPVNRFAYSIPDDQTFRAPDRNVMAASPDGRSFVYNMPEGLYLRTMEELEARLIPGTEEVLTSPFFSPDGQSIGYWQEGELRRIAVSGGAAVVLCAAANPLGASWAVDDTVLFGGPDGVMRVSANGGMPELIIPVEEEWVYGPQMLPDGDSVLFSVTSSVGLNRWDEAQIVAHSLGTGQRTVLLEDGSDARYVPTGHLVYAFEDRLFAVPFDAESLQVIGGPLPLAEGVMRAAGFGGATTNAASANYGISQQGALVYVSGVSVPQRTLVWVDREGREESVAAEPRAYTYPRISPDGTRVALQVRDQNEDIWIWDVARETPLRLTFDPGSDVHPVWTPDGERVVFSSVRDGPPQKVFWKAADGTGTVERFAEGPGLAAYSFSPDANT